jgi:hypothetical protein
MSDDTWATVTKVLSGLVTIPRQYWESTNAFQMFSSSLFACHHITEKDVLNSAIKRELKPC